MSGLFDSGGNQIGELFDGDGGDGCGFFIMGAIIIVLGWMIEVCGCDENARVDEMPHVEESQ